MKEWKKGKERKIKTSKNDKKKTERERKEWMVCKEPFQNLSLFVMTADKIVKFYNKIF